jgi:uncharacterized protein (TIGR03067 family)
MRRFGFVALVAGSLLGADQPGGAVRDELARLQGTWQLVSAETEGRKTPEEQAGKVRVVISGGTHTVRFGDQVVAHDVPFEIDPTTDPKQTTDTITEGPDKGKVIKGIYRLEGNTLTSCVAPAGKDRPTGFASQPGSGHTLRVFRRVKTDQSGGTVLQRERDRLKGRWRSATYTLDGKPTPPEQLADVVLTFGGDGMVEMANKGNVFVRGTAAIDPAANPRTMDLTFTEGPLKGKTALGIYEVEGDTYRLCRATPGKPRPGAFASGPGSGLALMTYRREGEDASVAAELKRFEGTWRYESTVVEGRRLPADPGKGLRLVLKGDRFTMTDARGAQRGTFLVNPSVTPRTIDVTFADGPQAGRTSRGIYELSGDTYTVCVGMAGRERPKEFRSTPGSGHVLQVLKREEP